MSKISKKPLVSIRNLSKQFDDGHIAVDSVNLDVYPKEFFSLLGGSGSGKSTLLRMLAGFEKPTDGKIIIDGVDMLNTPLKLDVNTSSSSSVMKGSLPRQSSTETSGAQSCKLIS